MNRHQQLGRRLSAEDFRALTARVLAGTADAPQNRPAQLSTIVVPDLLAAFRRADDAVAEQLTDEAEPRTESIASGLSGAGPDDTAEAASVSGGDGHLSGYDAGIGTMVVESSLDSGPVLPVVPAADWLDGDVAGPHGEAAGTDTDTTERPASYTQPHDGRHRAATASALQDALEPDRQSGETARMLLDIMAMPAGAVQPQERALAGDTLLRLVSRMPLGSVVSLCERLCIMETPPPLLVRRLIQDPRPEVAGPLLERCPAISDQDLMNLIGSADAARLRLFVRRRHLSPALTNTLIELGDSSVLLTVVRNPGAVLSPEAFAVLAEWAKSHHGLQAPLATRADTPAPIAFELFWSLPPELRRYVLSRFLTESATLDRILKIAHTLDDAGGPDGTAPSRTAERGQIDELVGLIAEGHAAEAASMLAALASISHSNAVRIISDPAGEPLTVAMKALGLSRTQFAAAAETLNNAPAAPLRAQRRLGELKTLFDSLSFTKARVLLTYWDWAVEQSGPYSGESE